MKADLIKTIEIENPIDSIINRIKNLLNTGNLNPGDRLPAERKLAENLGVSRTHVRAAIKRLEFYGILKTVPQSGTFVAGLDLKDMEVLIQDALQVESYDLISLAEARIILETNSIRLACQRRTDEDLKKIEQAVNLYEEKISKGVPAVEEDLSFHRQIAEASRNKVLKTMILIIAPDLMTNYRKFWDICDSPQRSIAAMEHRLLLEHIRNRDEESAATMAAHHLRGVLEYAKTQSVKY